MSPPTWSVRNLTGDFKIAAGGGGADTATVTSLIGRGGASRPDPVQAAWLYAQIVRWGQAALSEELRGIGTGRVPPDLYDAALGGVAFDAPEASRRRHRLASSVPASIRRHRQDIWPPGASDGPAAATVGRALIFCSAQYFRTMRREWAKGPLPPYRLMPG